MPTGVYERKPMGPYNNKTSADRFWAKVNKESGSDCWEWTAALDVDRYGKFWVNGKMTRAHRFSYEIHKGEIPSGMCILHSCDNRKCVKPEHLSAGTNADNMRDKASKNRCNSAKGSALPQSKLNEEQVKQIREKLNLGLSQRTIAKEYGVNQPTISFINTGKTWNHVNV